MEEEHLNNYNAIFIDRFFEKTKLWRTHGILITLFHVDFFLLS